MIELQQLVRPNIWFLSPYSSARHEFEGHADVYLDANENPYGAPYSRYPDPLQLELKKKIGSLKDIDVSRIFLGNGSDEAIDLLIRIFCEPGKDEIIVLPPTYGMYKVSSDIAGVKVTECMLTDDYQPNLIEIRQCCNAFSKILFLCSPNNPTGNLMNRSLVEEILLFFPGIVVIDEAYIDFSEEPGWLSQLDRFPNLVILQTLSKAWGLAAIRLGIAFASKPIIDLLNKVKPPYNVNELTQAEALRTLGESSGRKNREVAEILVERDQLSHQLSTKPGVIKIHPSDANFLLVQFKESAKVFSVLRDQGIVVRDRSKTPLCMGCLRITIGTPAENQRLLETLDKIL